MGIFGKVAKWIFNRRASWKELSKWQEFEGKLRLSESEIKTMDIGSIKSSLVIGFEEIKEVLKLRGNDGENVSKSRGLRLLLEKYRNADSVEDKLRLMSSESATGGITNGLTSGWSRYIRSFYKKLYNRFLQLEEEKKKSNESNLLEKVSEETFREDEENNRSKQDDGESEGTISISQSSVIDEDASVGEPQESEYYSCYGREGGDDSRPKSPEEGQQPLIVDDERYYEILED